MAHWRDSARVPYFYIIDAWATFPLLLFLLHIRMWTFILAACATTFFAILRRFGFTIPIFFRWFRGAITSKRKLSSPWWK